MGGRGDVTEVVGDGGTVLGVEVGVDFVKEVEGGGVALLDGEDEGEGAETCCFFLSVFVFLGSGEERGWKRGARRFGKKGGGEERRGERRILTLLPPTQLLDPLLIVVFAVEADADADARVVLDGFLPGGGGVVLARGAVFSLLPCVDFPLDHQPPPSGRHEFLKHLGELPTHLLERPLDGFVFPLVQHGDQLLDAVLRGFQLPAPFRQRVPLGGEVVVLLKGLFVDVAVFLQRFVDFMQFLDDGVGFGGFVFVEGAGGEDAQVADSMGDFFFLLGEDAAFADRLFRLLLRFLHRRGNFREAGFDFGISMFEVLDAGGGLFEGSVQLLEFGVDSGDAFGDGLQFPLGFL